FGRKRKYFCGMKTLIVDDNKIARTTMKQLTRQVTDMELVGECANAMEVYDLLREQSIDLLLLDIELPGMTGIELTKNLGNRRPVIIFTTAKKEYAVEAFELNVADYIVKPVTLARFLQAVEKAREMIESNKTEVKTEEDEFVFIRDSNVVRRLKI